MLYKGKRQSPLFFCSLSIVEVKKMKIKIESSGKEGQRKGKRLKRSVAKRKPLAFSTRRFGGRTYVKFGYEIYQNGGIRKHFVLEP